MSQVRKANPEKNCFLQSDKLYIDSKIYVYNEVLGQVVEHSESVRSCIDKPESKVLSPKPEVLSPKSESKVWVQSPNTIFWTEAITIHEHVFIHLTASKKIAKV